MTEPAKTRLARRARHNKKAQEIVEFQASRAFIIGVNAYGNDIPKLSTAVSDATVLAEVLEEQHNFETKLLVDRKATLAKVTAELDPAQEGSWASQVGPDDRIVFYFAGHGIADEGDDGPAGFVLPQDAHPEKQETFWAMTALHDALVALPCRHALIILDCCFAGAMRWSTMRAVHRPPQEIHKQRYERFIKSPAWQLLTSAAYDQTALDVLHGRLYSTGRPSTDGKHSPFAAALIQALSDGAADSFPKHENGQTGDGLLTANELFQFLNNFVWEDAHQQKHEQTPELWPLRKHGNGEYVFLVPGRELLLKEAPPLTPDDNPYRGLKSFEAKHSHLFFGREGVIREIIGQVSAQPLTVVLGASGTGKSSVVRAGVIPVLKGETVLEEQEDHQHSVQKEAVDAQEWSVLPPIRPTERPLQELKKLLQRRLWLVSSTVRSADLETDPQALSDIVAAWAKKNAIFGSSIPQKLVLVIDQFEELVTQCQDAAERKQFFDLFVNALKNHADHFRVILTLRSDFEPQFADLAPHEYWDKGRYIVPPMSHAELREVIEGPASVKVLYFDPPALIDKLVEEVSQTPGGLPLLSFALSEMYLNYVSRDSDDRALTMEDYKALGGDEKRAGGVVGALRNRANQIYESLDEASQDTMRRLMLRMVAAEGGEMARRRVPLTELEYADEAENGRKEAIIKQLTQARLIVHQTVEHEDFLPEKSKPAKPRPRKNLDALLDALPGGNAPSEAGKSEASVSETGGKSDLSPPPLPPTSDPALDTDDHEHEPYLEPAHDALVRSWDKLLKWRREAQAYLTLQRQITTEANDWAAETDKKKKLDLLWHNNARLPQVEFFLSQEMTKGISLPWYTRLWGQVKAWFSDAQITTDEYWLNKLELDFIHQSISTKHRQRRRRFHIATTIYLILIVLVIFALGQWDTANTETRYSRIRQLAAQSQAAPDSQTSQSLLLALESMGRVNEDDPYQAAPEQALREALQRPLGLPLTNFALAEDSVEALSPDGQWLAIANTQDYTIQVYSINALDSDPINLPGHDEAITTIAFNPSGDLLATASDDETVIIWSIQEPTADPLILTESVGVTALAFNSDSSLLGMGYDDGLVEVGDISEVDGDIAALEQHDDQINALTFSPHSDLLLTTGKDNRAILWDLASLDLIANFELADEGYGVTFSPDGQWFATADAANIIAIRSTAAPNEAPTSLEVKDIATSVTFSPDSQSFSAGSSDGTVWVWTVSEFLKSPTVFGHGVWVDTVLFAPDGQSLISLGIDGSLWEWPLNNAGVGDPQVMAAGKGWVFDVAFSPDGTWLASVHEDGLIRIWSTTTASSTPSQILTGHQGWVRSVTIDPQGKWLASGSNDQTVRLWAIDDLETEAQILLEAEEDIGQVAFSPDGRWLAARGFEDFVWLWTTDNFEQDPITLTEKPLNNTDPAVAFSPDGQWLATNSEGAKVLIWSLENLQADPIIVENPKVVSAIAFSPDSQSLATNSDSEIYIRSMNELSGNPIILSKHISLIQQLAFSPDNQWLASVSTDNTGRLWQVAGEIDPIALEPIILSHGQDVTGVAFSPDSQLLATSSGDQKVRLWTMDIESLIEKACKAAGRNFTVSEWQQIFVDDDYRQTCKNWPIPAGVTVVDR